MTRKEQLEQQYQKSRAANGYGAPRKALQDGPKGVSPTAKIVKRTITVGVIATALWWAYQAFVVAKPAFEEEEYDAVEERADEETPTASENGNQRAAKETEGKVSEDQIK